MCLLILHPEYDTDEHLSKYVVDDYKSYKNITKVKTCSLALYSEFSSVYDIKPSTPQIDPCWTDFLLRKRGRRKVESMKMWHARKKYFHQ